MSFLFSILVKTLAPFYICTISSHILDKRSLYPIHLGKTILFEKHLYILLYSEIVKGIYSLYTIDTLYCALFVHYMPFSYHFGNNISLHGILILYHNGLVSKTVQFSKFCLPDNLTHASNTFLQNKCLALFFNNSA